MSAGVDALRLSGVVKRFAGVVALDGVELSLRPGEIHALVGENGAGKSTLVKILTGVYHRDGGEIFLRGRPVELGSPDRAQGSGVVAVHQELHLLPHLTVAENIFLGREPKRFGLLSWRTLFAETAALFDRLGLAVNPRAMVGTLRPAERQLIAIARGVSLDASVLLLDEPTSSLSEPDVALLFRLLGILRQQGAAIVYISHRLDELYAICDRVTVLRDGRTVGTHELAAVERLDLVAMMLGRSRAELSSGLTEFGDRRSDAASAESRPVVFEGRDLQGDNRLERVSLDVRRGEVVGLAGLLGSGRSETARAIAGADRVRAGSMSLKGERYTPRGPREAIASGVAYLAEERKTEGIIPEMSVADNLTLAALPLLTRWGVVRQAEQRRLVRTFVERLGIKAASFDQPIRELSGGNQQKVLLARWLCRRLDLLIVDEPTRGVDVGARREIQRLLTDLADQGLGLVMISSDLEEIVEGCDRVFVLRDGRSVGEFRDDRVTEAGIVRAMAGVDPEIEAG